MKKLLLILTLLIGTSLSAQSVTDTIQKLDEIIIETNRLSSPLASISHTITVMDSLQLAVLPVNSLDELLQNVNGVDVRRRGIDGMQSDLYIRGGNFEQVLLLIDGIKMDDIQTGHHTMNAIISPDNIDRIEIVKGAASRIYGQNAMNGAINIVTKKITNDLTNIQLKTGSFETYGAGFNMQKVLEKGSVLLQVDNLKSGGYRYNTDFDNWNALLKTDINQYEFLATFQERKFGANGFYASPLYKDQYEETQTNLVSVKRKFQLKSDFQLTAQAYWRRNQDMYLFIRNNPDYYRNLHISNKIGVSANSRITSKIGNTGVGVDINQGFLRSNNLGDRERLTTTLSLEHQFKKFDDKLDIVPGFALTHYSDFGTFFYPGIDIGYRFNSSFKTYVNMGYTSRIPTFTDLYYTSRTEQGNPDLKPEKALSSEIGLNFTSSPLSISSVYFYRNATDLIDWTKPSETDKWYADNFNEVITNGFEFSAKYRFQIGKSVQYFNAGYTFLNEKLSLQNVLTRYQLNSFKHQVNTVWHSRFSKNISQNIAYRHLERHNGSIYNVWDADVTYQSNKWKIQAQFNNIFSESYWETSLVPMPKFNTSWSLSYSF